MTELPKAYDPAAVEPDLYEDWDAAGLFHAEPDDDGEPFSIVIPPPNVTGSLHVGHALDNTIQDVIIRRERMRGKNAVWIPGTDHAGSPRRTSWRSSSPPRAPIATLSAVRPSSNVRGSGARSPAG